MRRLNADQRVECGLFLLVLRDGALQLDRDLLTLAGVDGCRQRHRNNGESDVLLRPGYVPHELSARMGAARRSMLPL